MPGSAANSPRYVPGADLCVGDSIRYRGVLGTITHLGGWERSRKGRRRYAEVETSFGFDAVWIHETVRYEAAR